MCRTTDLTALSWTTPGVKNTPLEPLVGALAPMLNSTAFMGLATHMMASLMQQQPGLNLTAMLQG